MSEFCPKIVTQEFLLSPTDVTYPLTTTTLYSLESVAHSIVNQHEYVVSTSKNVKLPVSYLLPIEVYSNLGENILQALFNENDQKHNSVVSDRFLSTLSTIWRENSELVAIIYSVLVQRIETFCQTSQFNLKQVLKSWRDDGDGIYRSLRKILDRISVFAGNSPLVSLIISVRLAVAIPCTHAVC